MTRARLRPATVLRVLGGLALGLSVGLGGVLWNSHWWGLLLTAAATFPTVLLLPSAARVGFTVGWLVPVVRGSVPTAAGDLLVFADWHGYALLVMGFVLAVATLLTSATPRTRPGRGEPPVPTR